MVVMLGAHKSRSSTGDNTNKSSSGPSSAVDRQEFSSAFRNPQFAVEPGKILGAELRGSQSPSSAEINSLKQRVASLAQNISGDPKLEVLPSPNGGWSCGIDPRAAQAAQEYLSGARSTLDDLPDELFRANAVYYDLADVRHSSDEAITRQIKHQLAHASHTDYRLIFKGQKQAQSEGVLGSEWTRLQNTLEGLWVNNKQIAESPESKPGIQKDYAERMPEIAARINSRPLVEQLASNATHYWLTGKNLPTLTNQQVRDTFERIRPAIDDYLNGASPHANYNLFRDRIWPEIRELAKATIESEARKEFAKKLSASAPPKAKPAEDQPRDRSNEYSRLNSSAGTSANDSSPAAQKKPNIVRRIIDWAKRLINRWRAKRSVPNSPPAQDENSSAPEGNTSGEQNQNSAEPKSGGRNTSGTESNVPPNSASGATSTQTGQDGAARSEASGDPANAGSSQTQQGPGAQNDAASTAAQSPLAERVRDALEAQRANAAARSRSLSSALSADSNGNDSLELASLDPELLAEVEKAFQSLSADEQVQLKQAAKEQIDARNREALEREHATRALAAQRNAKTGEYEFAPPPPPSEEERQALKAAIQEFLEHEAEALRAQEEEQRQAEIQQKLRELAKELQKRDMLKNGFSERESEEYRRFKQLEGAMRGKVNAFMRALAEYLPKKREVEHGGEFYTGSKLNYDAVVKRAPVKDYRIYQRKEPIESTEPRMFVTLIIDNSGSMAGTKMEESLKTAIFWARVLREFQIPFAIKLFDTGSRTIMSLQDDYDAPKSRVKPRLVSEATAAGGATNMGAPLEETYSEMMAARKRFVGCEGAVFVISDSGANRGRQGEELRSLISEMQQEMLVMNFILSTSPDEIKQAVYYFGEKNVIAPASFDALPQESFKVLRITLDKALRKFRTADS